MAPPCDVQFALHAMHGVCLYVIKLRDWYNMRAHVCDHALHDRAAQIKAFTRSICTGSCFHMYTYYIGEGSICGGCILKPIHTAI